MQISIIIPTLNRAALLRDTLASIAGQRFNRQQFEVIVVDNGSNDETAAVCAEFKDRISNLNYIFDAMPGQLTGRHRGLEASKTDLLAFLDDDVILNGSWLESLSKLALDNPDKSIFGGPSFPQYHGEQPAWLPQLFEKTPYGGKMCLPLSLLDLEKNEAEIDPIYVFGLNFIIRKKVLLELKGFHPDVISRSLQKFQGDGETGLTIKAGMQNLKAFYSVSLYLKHQIPKERLTTEFFLKWSFYSGVCKSFTDIRYQFGLYSERSLPVRPVTTFKLISAKLRGAFLKVRGRLKPKDNRDFFKQLTEQYKKGYSFHQEAFKNDPDVKSWVLKPDYFEYTLPVTVKGSFAL